MLAKLPDVTLALALYASDYVSERRPDPAKLAAFILDAVDRIGLPELVHRTCHLVAFDQKADDEAMSRDDRAKRDGMFDAYRLIHCTMNRPQVAAVRRYLLALDTEAVAA
ncbi:hypothetical protein [Streptomyces sp. NPDC003006]